MCGIAGIVQLTTGGLDIRLLEAMTDTLVHRGPDGEGYVLFAPGRGEKPFAIKGALALAQGCRGGRFRAGFGHRRLAIIDPTELGHQPMGTEDGFQWITYNGEVYNAPELRRELAALGYRFRSTSDTEVVLASYRRWGADCLSRFNGMFALAIWDDREQTLFCARDRLGMKPFYYHATPSRFLFASEIKALLADPDILRRPHLPLVYDFLALGLQDHTDETLFAGIRQLRPGHALILHDGRITVRKWWDLESPTTRASLSEQDTIREFQQRFEQAVRVHLRSDVPVGSCLSGGLDSSSVVCMMRRELSREPIRTFTAGFEDAACDERRYARAVVRLVGAEPVEITPDPRRLFEEVPRVVHHQDEPFAGTSYLAQWAVMRAASESGVKVLLDGQGGDELLCGYPGYWGSYLGDLIRRGALIRAVAEGGRCLRQQAGLHRTLLSNLARAVLPRSWVAATRWRMKGHGAWVNPDFANAHRDRDAGTFYGSRFPTQLDNHVAAYLQTHSLPALLHHEDRSAMAFSVEARLPFLDASLVELLMRVPAEYKLRHGLGKHVLREAMAGVLPEEVRTRRDKLGFATPQDRWLRRDLRDALEDVFASKSFAERPYWDAIQVRRAYRAYCDGESSGGEIGSTVWRWICLEVWHQQFLA
ncbi:MAG: asparagine synthase (glutamine-hydrolyzing) [Nitrospirales bacterium]